MGIAYAARLTEGHLLTSNGDETSPKLYTLSYILYIQYTAPRIMRQLTNLTPWIHMSVLIKPIDVSNVPVIRAISIHTYGI